MIDLRRYTLGAIVMVAMLAGCGSSNSAGNGVLPNNGAPERLPGQHTFHFTGKSQDFKVPAGVTHITVVARGATGAGNPIADGGRVHAVIPVTPGETLVVYVGGDASGTTGGFNGGASGGATGSRGGKGGGGATDVRQGGTSLGDRIIVSGGGGGVGQKGDTYGDGIGGKGGGKTGGTGGCVPFYSSGSGCERFGGYGGYGGTQYGGGQGGAGGNCFIGSGTQGEDGAFGIGGNGSAGDLSSGYSTFGGGGGGGGYYGGGGGGSGCSYNYYNAGGGGGGGGSSYAERSATDVRFWQGWKNPTPNGLVVFSW
jgi:hypothetical protein